MSKRAPGLESRTRLVRIFDGRPGRAYEHSALSVPTGDGIMAPNCIAIANAQEVFRRTRMG
jgi:hypothetical protein